MAIIRGYALGVFIAMIIFLIGAKIYIYKEDMQKLGAKAMVGSGAVLLALVWPISKPLALAYALKTIVGYIVRSLFKDVEDELTKKTD